MRPDAPTACEGWSAHDVVAHLAAGSEEMARLVRLRLERGRGADIGPTRPFDEREAPYRALPDRRLRRRFVQEGIVLTEAILRLRAAGDDLTVPFTGWDMTADEMIRHGRSELVLHRWDLVGFDEVSRRLLDDAELLAHGRKVVAPHGVDRGAGRSGFAAGGVWALGVTDPVGTLSGLGAESGVGRPTRWDGSGGTMRP